MQVYGKNVLLDMNPSKIRKVYLSSKKNDNKILSYLKENHIRYEFVSIERLNKMADGNHQGVVLEIDDYNYGTLSDCDDDTFVLILDHLEDPHKSCCRNV